MGTVQSWLIGKGLALAESSVKSLLDIEDSQAILSNQIDRALQKIDRLLGAPYEAARLHARAGEREKAIDHLKDAIARQPLHLPARLFHIKLLSQEKRYEEALDNYWDLMRAFSYREDLFPPLLYQAFLDKVTRSPVRPGGAPLQIRRWASDSTARSVWCSPTAVAVEWASHYEMWFLKWDEIAVTACNWDGKVLFDSASSSRISLAMLTSEYAVYQDGDQTFRILGMLDGKELAESPLDEETFRALFSPPGRDLASLQLYRLSHFGPEQLASGQAAFSDVALRSGTYTEQEEQEVPVYCGDTDPIFTRETVTTWWGTVECEPRAVPTLDSAAERACPTPKPELVEIGWKGMD